MIEVKKSFSVPLYGGIISVVISNERDVYESAKRHFHVDELSLKTNDAVVLGQSEGKRIYPVLFCKYITPGIVAHEAKHIVNRIFRDVDIQIDRYNDEYETYLLSWIVNRIWEVKLKYEKLLNEESNRTIEQ